MGSGQSRDSSAASDTPAKTVRIDRDEIPEEYKTVGVSDEVVQRIIGKRGDSVETDQLKSELVRERETNEQLREQMKHLVDVQRNATPAAPQREAGIVPLEEVEARKKAFEEAIERVEKQFFSYQRENACLTNENEISDCVSHNKTRLLKCAPLLNDYKSCVSEFRQRVLEEVTKA